MLAVACASALVFFHLPLPWEGEEPLVLPPIYLFGVWLSIVVAIGVTSLYAFQVTEDTRKLSDALAATELVLDPRTAPHPARRPRRRRRPTGCCRARSFPVRARSGRSWKAACRVRGAARRGRRLGEVLFAGQHQFGRGQRVGKLAGVLGDLNA